VKENKIQMVSHTKKKLSREWRGGLRGGAERRISVTAGGGGETDMTVN